MKNERQGKAEGNGKPAEADRRPQAEEKKAENPARRRRRNMAYPSFMNVTIQG